MAKSKFHLICSCVDCKKQLTVQNLVSHYKTHLLKPAKSRCAECNTPLYNNNKFCSTSCAAIFNNARKDYSKIRTGPKPGVKPKFTKIKPCVMCDHLHPGAGQTCSPKCKSSLLSIRVKERIYNGWNPNSNRGRGRQSYLESSFENYIKTTFPGINYITEYKIKRLDMIKTYYADFYFPDHNLIIELDGTQHKKTVDYDNERDAYIKDIYGFDIFRISHSEYQKKSKINDVVALLKKH